MDLVSSNQQLPAGLAGSELHDNYHHQNQNYNHHNQPAHLTSRLSFDERHEPEGSGGQLLDASRLAGGHQEAAGQAATTTTAANEMINWSQLMKYVNLNLVRNMIAQHAAELIVLCVIIIYLVYYFSRISQRPKLVGSSASKFVKIIRDNFQDSLGHRFNPLIYFWGTNPQTALFGYLQGQTSDKEVPRNKFKRQYLFVSDAQYLASNIDLSEHYEQQQQQQLSSKLITTSNSHSKSECSSEDEQQQQQQAFKTHHHHNHHRLVRHQQLDAGQLLLGYNSTHLASGSPNLNASTINNNDPTTSLLNQNIRLAMANQMGMITTTPMTAHAKNSFKRKESGIVLPEEEEQEMQIVTNPTKGVQMQQQHQVVCSMINGGQAANLPLKSLTRTASSNSSDSSAMGSSSDSGVFVTGANSSSSSSSSHSGSSLTIDMESTDKPQRLHQNRPQRQLNNHQEQQQQQLNYKQQDDSKQQTQAATPSCSCTALYELGLQSFDSENHNIQTINSERSQFEQIDCLEFAPTISEHQQQNQQVVKREQLEFGQCALDWYVESHKHFHQNNKVALISAGMTTGSDKKYVTDTVQTLDKLGYEVCVFIRRGVGGLKLSSAKFFSPSKWRDFEAAILSVKKQRPNARLVAIGFSFGSIELCRYLSMSGAQSLVDSALLISCPFDPEAGGRNMRKRALNRKIDAYLAKNLGKQLYQALAEGAISAATISAAVASSQQQEQSSNKKQIHINYNGSMVDLSSLPKIKSLVDFEDNFNRLIQNYPSSDAYADDSRLSELLANIETPTLCLSSEDDFMAPMKLLPIKQIEANKNLCMILTKRGGHMAFIDGILWPKRPYFAQRIIEKYMKLDMMTSWSPPSNVAAARTSAMVVAADASTTTTMTTSTTTATPTMALGGGVGGHVPEPIGVARSKSAAALLQSSLPAVNCKEASVVIEVGNPEFSFHSIQQQQQSHQGCHNQPGRHLHLQQQQKHQETRHHPARQEQHQEGRHHRRRRYYSVAAYYDDS